MKNNSKIVAFTSLLLICGYTYSGTMGKFHSPYRGVYTIGAGPLWGHQSTQQTILIQPDIVKTYDSNKLTSPALAGEIFAGLAHDIKNCIGEIGIELAGVNNLKLTGDILEDADSDFNNYRYKYDIQHARIAVKGRLLTEIQPQWLGYISGGVGVGVNSARNFTITPKIFEEVPAPEFTNNNTTVFTYSLGVGVQTQMPGNWQYGLGYQFADLGKSELGRAPGQTLGTGIRLNNLYTHQLLFSISYLCD